MKSAPIRFANAAFWPATIWLSITHLDEHPADDYVERTSPIVAVAIAFWLGAAGIAGLWFANGPKSVFDVLLLVTPVLYIIGFWLFTARDTEYPR